MGGVQRRRGFSCGVVIVAGGTHYKRPGLAQEERFRGRGVVDCTPCDGGFFVDRDVVIYGSNDHAVRDALYPAGLGGRVTLLASDTKLEAVEALQTRMRSTPGVSVRSGVRLEAILGSDRVEWVQCVMLDSAEQEQLVALGLLVRVGAEPSTQGLEDVIDLDKQGYIVTDAQLETCAPNVLASGDIRSGARWSVAAAVGEGASAAGRALAIIGATSTPDQ
jgi:thioredoxin reductase (NADPH)